MAHPYGLKSGQPAVWYHQRPARGNRHCLYCGRIVGDGAEVESDREHLVGRNFVPTGTLADGAFNLIFRACRECNAAKSALERHVSTVTLFNSPSRAAPDVDALAERKAAKDRHPRKPGVPVCDAGDTQQVAFERPGFRLSFELVSPPQLDEAHAVPLASYHVQGLYALVTSSDPRRSEGSVVLDPSRVHTLGVYGRLDWGNPQLIEFARRAAGWPCYAIVDTADGHFKAVLRRNPELLDQWFWALEWNRAVRLTGVIAESDAGADPEVAIAQDLPPLDWRPMPGGPGFSRRMREEIPLAEEQDTLFAACPEPNAPG